MLMNEKNIVVNVVDCYQGKVILINWLSKHYYRQTLSSARNTESSICVDKTDN